MFDDSQIAGLTLLAIVGAGVAGAIGLLGGSRIRTVFIGLWSFAPTIFIALVGVSIACRLNLFTPEQSPLFPAVLILVVQPPWLLFTLLAFNLVRRYREIQRWEV